MANPLQDKKTQEKAIKHLLEKRNIQGAIDYIVKPSNSMNLNDEELSKIVFEYYIHHNEPACREVFDRNIKLLKDNHVLFTNLGCGFDDIKRNAFTKAYCLNTTANLSMSKATDQIFFVVDFTNIEVLKKFLEIGVVYLVFDNPGNFYAMLLFNDLSDFRKYIEANKIIFFVGRDKTLLSKFFSKLETRRPSMFIDLSIHNDYHAIMDKINNNIRQQTGLTLEIMNKYYRCHDFNYYRKLFTMQPADIKILFITSKNTTINQYITKNWFNAFMDLGYNSRFLIDDSKAYVSLHTGYILEQLNIFKPDMVFYINYASEHVCGKNETSKSLMWILRYRDIATLSEYIGHAANMFILPMTQNGADEIKMLGFPENRMYLTPDGVDASTFKKKVSINGRYACDITSVNNQVGNELNCLNRICSMSGRAIAEKVIDGFYKEAMIMDFQGEVCSIKDIRIMLTKRLSDEGLYLDDNTMKLVVFEFAVIFFSFYRRKIIEWIIDSKITSDLKLWGSGWSQVERFRRFHMGQATYGEELSCIYQASKISLSDQPGASLHERTFEILASGGFPLVKHVETYDDGKDRYNITDYFMENEDIVLFYGKDDLLNKIQLYLDRPEERERIAENGRMIVQEHFTNVAVARKTMEFIKGYYA
ncbi:MAG TPA: hypothetical protein DD725_12485 [Deltaproteobacteria bacterium]|nr:hypothetical protein [Deltaproteobacteria bacterium]